VLSDGAVRSEAMQQERSRVGMIMREMDKKKK
jgi:hypothetical protein